MHYTPEFDTMDKRLNQIQTGTLTESRMNDDFVFWMKTTGLNIVLVVLLIGCGYMGWQWWSRTQNQARADAWRKLDRATTPQDLALVASEAGTIDSVVLIAKVRAADTYLESLMSGVRFDREAGAEDAKVTPELRREWFDNADQLYLEVAQSLSDANTPVALQPMAFHALMGRAAIAESRGDAAAASRYLDEAAARVATAFPALAEVAKKRQATVEVASLGIELPPAAALPEGAAGGSLADPMLNMPQIPGMRITPSNPGGTPGQPLRPVQPTNNPGTIIVPAPVAPTATAPTVPPASSAPSAPPAPAPAPPAP